MNSNSSFLEKINKDEIIKRIIASSKDKNVYLVGGAVRDFYLGKENFDKDIVIEEGAEKFAIELSKIFDATFIPLDEENKIYRLVLKDKVNYIDVAGLMGDNIKEDLLRRDLTINSVAVNLKTMDVLDFTGGIEDLKNGKIKHILENNFTDDPLRLLRVYRFQAMLGFDIDKMTNILVKKHSRKISKPAVERVSYELIKLFSGDFCAKSIIDMDKSGILEEILPVVSDLKKVPPNLHHHLNLFEHSVETVSQVQRVYEQSEERVKKHLDTVDFGGFSRLAHLKLAAFLHDIGKFSTWTIEEGTGKHRFIKHDDVGAKMCMKILKNLKFSKKQIEYISKMIKNHIYPSHVIQAPEINDKIYMRVVRKMENDIIDIIVLAMADRFSARGVEITEEIINKNIDGLEAMLDFYLNIKDSLKPLPKLLSGEDIMAMLDIKPSKELGAIIKELHEAQLTGDVVTKEDAESFVRGLKAI